MTCMTRSKDNVSKQRMKNFTSGNAFFTAGTNEVFQGGLGHNGCLLSSSTDSSTMISMNDAEGISVSNMDAAFVVKCSDDNVYNNLVSFIKVRC